MKYFYNFIIRRIFAIILFVFYHIIQNSFIVIFPTYLLPKFLLSEKYTQNILKYEIPQDPFAYNSLSQFSKKKSKSEKPNDSRRRSYIRIPGRIHRVSKKTYKKTQPRCEKAKGRILAYVPLIIFFSHSPHPSGLPNRPWRKIESEKREKIASNESEAILARGGITIATEPRQTQAGK